MFQLFVEIVGAVTIGVEFMRFVLWIDTPRR